MSLAGRVPPSLITHPHQPSAQIWCGILASQTPELQCSTRLSMGKAKKRQQVVPKRFSPNQHVSQMDSSSKPPKGCLAPYSSLLCKLPVPEAEAVSFPDRGPSAFAVGHESP